MLPTSVCELECDRPSKYGLRVGTEVRLQDPLHPVWPLGLAGPHPQESGHRRGCRAPSQLLRLLRPTGAQVPEAPPLTA